MNQAKSGKPLFFTTKIQGNIQAKFLQIRENFRLNFYGSGKFRLKNQANQGNSGKFRLKTTGVRT